MPRAGLMFRFPFTSSPCFPLELLSRTLTLGSCHTILLLRTRERFHSNHQYKGCRESGKPRTRSADFATSYHGLQAGRGSTPQRPRCPAPAAHLWHVRPPMTRIPVVLATRVLGRCMTRFDRKPACSREAPFRNAFLGRASTRRPLHN